MLLSIKYSIITYLYLSNQDHSLYDSPPQLYNGVIILLILTFLAEYCFLTLQLFKVIWRYLVFSLK